MSRTHSHWLLRAAVLVLATPLAAAGQAAKPLPLKYVGPATNAEISAGDLMTRLYKYADDSMMGRQFGTEWNTKATAYIEREVRRLGLKPAGDNGSYFQNLPVVSRTLDATSTLVVEGTTFKAGTDFVAVTLGTTHATPTAAPLFLGTQYDTAGAPDVATVRGQVVLVRPFQPGPGFNRSALMAHPSFAKWQAAVNSASVVLVVSGPQLPPATVRQAMSPATGRLLTDRETPVQVTITTAVAEMMFGAPVASLVKGATGKPVTFNVTFTDKGTDTRNVVAVLPGSDPKLSGQYVAIGAHSDHIGFRPTATVEHDSLKAFMQIVRPQGADNAPAQATPEQVVRVKALTDSLRAAHGGPRLDSIFNGADDDGSGTVTVLEIAEQFAKGTVKPKRSMLFVWHTGEEAGLLGSAYFTDHPTVPRDSIVAQLNMDMVGRGRATDVTGDGKDGGLLHGGPGYLQLVGSRRLSTELGDLVETVNKESNLKFNFDYSNDANGHPQKIYCRSDHYEYARYGIPIVFFSTGGHADYHQLTDEPQYIDYEHMSDISKLVFNSAVKVANLNHRVVVDKPKPDPRGSCVQ